MFFLVEFGAFSGEVGSRLVEVVCRTAVAGDLFWWNLLFPGNCRTSCNWYRTTIIPFLQLCPPSFGHTGPPLHQGQWPLSLHHLLALPMVRWDVFIVLVGPL